MLNPSGPPGDRIEGPRDPRPWPALVALAIGFFMIIVDTTVIPVAAPAIARDFDAGVNDVVWVTSSYLLAYVTPVLITGRLGDRYGPRRLYIAGLVVFTSSSLWCGLADDMSSLILARVFQGLGASLMTPQTMAVITRIFPSDSRGKAMALWGTTAGLATLTGPLVGGLLVDTAGWRWIFMINIPVGAIALVLTFMLVPTLAVHEHRFDWLGVVLSGVAVTLVVFGVQEGPRYDWGVVSGLASIPLMIAVGVVIFAAFIWSQAMNRGEPLVPLTLFRDRNFSVANVAISVMGFAATAVSYPVMVYAQLGLGATPTQAALLFAPMAIVTLLLAPQVGSITDRTDPRSIISTGFAACVASLIWLSAVMSNAHGLWHLVLPMALLGVGNALVWAPNSTAATRNLPLHRAGAGAGVYNATRQVGAVFGSAAVASVIDARLAAHHVGMVEFAGRATGSTAGLGAAMGEATLLPAGVLVIGLLAATLFSGSASQVSGAVSTKMEAS